MKTQDQWSSKIGFILAAAGSAIGLGAIWKFPYMVGTNGGGVFFLLFIVFTLIIGTPMLLAEFVIGRRGQADAVTSYKKLAPKSKWHWLGYLGVAASFILLSFYSVVGGWVVSYIGRSFSNTFMGRTEEEYGQLFNHIIANPAEVLIAQFVFMIMTMYVVQGGVQKGIERASKYMMPALFILFIVLAVRSLTLDGAWKGVKFFLAPNLDAMNGQTVLMALGQSFFALSVGISVMVTYASYLPKKDSLPKSAFSVSILNIFISFLAGIVIFPAVFALGFKPNAGPGLVFVVLPAVFNHIAFGHVFFIVFLILLLFATLTSAFSILEIIVAVLSKEVAEKRKKYTWIAGTIVFLFGIPSALSFGVLSDVKIMGKSFFDFADFLTSNIGLPLGSLLISLFVGYRLPRKDVVEEMRSGTSVPAYLFGLWYFSVRYLIPLAIVFIFLQSLNLI
ncbi:sodium-dependent transporter [Falsibacillus albus]|uniref:Transporter n=1 Tax=Falsibacillus albus TaxID=2478915 RepID=A0A3L7K099_9BACI|nr:sodium-dependent transporter [Falsibacillus albus]RLQ96487.1 sodium-dependent transporter [Falsibacillus albus]